MSFYEDVSKAKFFQIDKIFQNRTEMDEAAYTGNDDVFIGHFVLVKYDSISDGVTENSIISGYSNNETNLLNSINEILTQIEQRKNGTRLEPVDQINFTFQQELTNNNSVYLCKNFGDFPIYHHDKEHWENYYYYAKNRYMKLSKEDDYKENLIYYGIFTPTEQEELDDTCYYLATVIDLPGLTPGNIYYIPCNLFNSESWSKNVDTVYKIDTSRNPLYVSNGQFLRYIDSNNNLTDYYFQCVGQESYQSDTAIWNLITDEDIAAVSDSNFKYKYFKNYKIDKQRYQIDASFRGYDATIWQKTYANGYGRYVLVASLNAQIPSFNIVTDPPNTDVSAPYFGNDSADLVYTLHMPSLYGFRIKEAGANELSDQRILAKLDDENSREINAKIYYNLGNRDHRLSSFKDSSENRLDITPGSSGASYVDSYGVRHENINDYLELSLNFPVLGNVVDEGYDLYYGSNVGFENKRALDTKYYFVDEVLDGENQIEENDKRFLGNNSLNGKSFDLNTLAGTLNTAHNVLGQIVYRLDKPINEFTTEELEELNNEYIYEYQNKYYRKGYQYNIEDTLDDQYYLYQAVDSQVMQSLYVDQNNNNIQKYKDFFIYDSTTESYIQNPNEQYNSSLTYYLRFIDKYLYERISLSPASPTGQYYTKDLNGNYFLHEIFNPLIDEGLQFYTLTGIQTPAIPLNSTNLKVLQNLYLGYNSVNYPGASQGECGRFIKASVEDIQNYNDGILYNIPIYERNGNVQVLNDLLYPDVSYQNYLNEQRSGFGNFAQDLLTAYNDYNTTQTNNFIQTIIAIPCLSDIYQKIYVYYENNLYHWTFFLSSGIKGSSEYESILEDLEQQNFSGSGELPRLPKLVLLNTPLSQIENQENLKLYVPEYYWTKNNNNFIKYNSYEYNGSELYLITEESFKDAFYVPNTYYTKVNDSTYNLETGEYDSNKNYYKRKKFIVLTDTEGRFERGNIWPAKTSEVPPGVSLGILSASPALIEMDLFNGEDSLFGMALKINKLYGLRDNLERNPYTLMGIINKGKDLLSQFDTLEAGKVLGLNNYGQISTTDFDFEGLRVLFEEANDPQNQNSSLKEIASALNNLSSINWERFRVLTQYPIANEDNTHYNTINPQTKDLDYYYGRLIYLFTGDNFNNLLNLLAIGEQILKKLKVLATIIDFEPASVLNDEIP